jgi:hypothetical protein
VSELNVARINDIDLISILAAQGQPLDWATYVDESIMEEAKIGLDKRLRNSLGTPPYAALKRVHSNFCYERKMCASYSYDACLMRPAKKHEPKEFPRCWQVDEKDELRRELITSIIFKWREGRYVLIVRPDVLPP